MSTDRFYSQILHLIRTDQAPPAMVMLAGQLAATNLDAVSMRQARNALRRHELHQVLLEDPSTHRAFHKPRGYAGDAQLMDLLYDLDPPETTTSLGRVLFEVSREFQASRAVRTRRDIAQDLIETAWSQGKTICVLACGHLREADALVSKDLANVTAVDQDRLSLDEIALRHGRSVHLEQANVFQYLRKAVRSRQQFDLIYTLGLADYLDDRAMALLHKLAKACLKPGGRFMLANFLPDHLGAGWMDACMDWHLIYRDEANLKRHAAKAGFAPRTYRDPSGAIVYCEMDHA